MNYTNTELKKIAKAALKEEYGFAPAATSITLLEASGDGTYILFSVGGVTYSYESCALKDGHLVPCVAKVDKCEQ